MSKKPRIWKQYYPKNRRCYWRVSRMPKPFNRKDAPLWNAAYKFISKLDADKKGFAYITKYETCDMCSGTGESPNGGGPCCVCDGKGVLEKGLP